MWPGVKIYFERKKAERDSILKGTYGVAVLSKKDGNHSWIEIWEKQMPVSLEKLGLGGEKFWLLAAVGSDSWVRYSIGSGRCRKAYWEEVRKKISKERW